MAHVLSLDGVTPRVADDAFLAPTAVLIGDVVVAPGASVWFGAVVRADFGSISIGPGTCIQDNAVLHTSEHHPTVIGANVTVGHLAMLEGCVVEDGALIGMGSIVLQRAHLGAGAMLAAGTVVVEGQEIPGGVLAAGAPAKVKKELAGASAGWVEMAAREYQGMRLRYMSGAREALPLRDGAAARPA